MINSQKSIKMEKQIILSQLKKQLLCLIKISVIYSILFSLSCCNTDSKESTIKNELKNAEFIKGKIISKDNKILKEPLRMVYIDPYLIYYASNNGKAIKKFDTNQGIVTDTFCNIGKGPQELMMIGNFQVSQNSQISLYDIIKKKIFTIDINTGELTKRVTLKEQASQAFLVEEKNGYIINGIFHNCRFKYFQDDSLVSTFKIFPQFEHQNDDTIFLNLGYQNFSAISPDCKKIANIIYESEIIECFYIDSSTFRREWSHEWSMLPFTMVKIGQSQMAKHSENAFGLKNMAVNNDYIYCVYCKLPVKETKPLTASGKYLVVFKWNGDIYKTYELDYPVRTIAVSKSGKKLFATSIINNDVKILQYEL